MEVIVITVQAIVPVAPAEAWQYYTQPQHIVNWNFASADWHCPSASIDLVEGGKMHMRMEAKDGSFGFDFEGNYTLIINHQQLDYTIADGRKVSIIFTNNGTSTHITVRFEAETMNSIELQKQGWQAILNNYKLYVEQQSPK
ncbi:MAG: SRPBCC domain-containing protein [Chitinophagaceae bacterium]